MPYPAESSPTAMDAKLSEGEQTEYIIIFYVRW